MAEKHWRKPNVHVCDQRHGTTRGGMEPKKMEPEGLGPCLLAVWTSDGVRG